MKLENIKVRELYKLKTVKKSKELLEKENLLDDYDIEEIIDNTYNDEDCQFVFAEGEIVKAIYVDSKDNKFNVKIASEDEGYTIWTNAHCLKKIK